MARIRRGEAGTSRSAGSFRADPGGPEDREAPASAITGEPATHVLWRPRVLLVAPLESDRRWLDMLFENLQAACLSFPDARAACVGIGTSARWDLACLDVSAWREGGPFLLRAFGRTASGRPPVVLFGDRGDPGGAAPAQNGEVQGWVDRTRLRLGWTCRFLSGWLHPADRDA